MSQDRGTSLCHQGPHWPGGKGERIEQRKKVLSHLILKGQWGFQECGEEDGKVRIDLAEESGILLLQCHFPHHQQILETGLETRPSSCIRSDIQMQVFLRVRGIRSRFSDRRAGLVPDFCFL